MHKSVNKITGKEVDLGEGGLKCPFKYRMLNENGPYLNDFEMWSAINSANVFKSSGIGLIWISLGYRTSFLCRR